MNKLNINKPLKVAALFLKGNTKPLRNRIVFIAGNFLIVGQDEEDTRPTWYNMDKVDRLEGVEELPHPNNRGYFF